MRSFLRNWWIGKHLGERSKPPSSEFIEVNIPILVLDELGGFSSKHLLRLEIVSHVFRSDEQIKFQFIT